MKYSIPVLALGLIAHATALKQCGGEFLNNFEEDRAKAHAEATETVKAEEENSNDESSEASENEEEVVLPNLPQESETEGQDEAGAHIGAANPEQTALE